MPEMMEPQGLKQATLVERVALLEKRVCDLESRNAERLDRLYNAMARLCKEVGFPGIYDDMIQRDAMVAESPYRG